jgi:hypothetical protein
MRDILCCEGHGYSTTLGKSPNCPNMSYESLSCTVALCRCLSSLVVDVPGFSGKNPLNEDWIQYNCLQVQTSNGMNAERDTRGIENMQTQLQSTRKENLYQAGM